MRRVLLAGGAGYIGAVVSDELLAAGYGVRCLDNLIYGHGRSVEFLKGRPGYEFQLGDLCDGAARERSLDGVQDVVVLAGLVGDPITKKYPQASGRINDEGIRAFLSDLNGRGLGRALFISTCSNYGLVPEGSIASECSELKPLSLYATAKVENERYLLSLKGRTDFTGTVLRFATAFGLSRRMRFDLTVNEFTREAYLKGALSVYDADTWRPYCHVRDFARVIRLALEAPRDRVDFEVFNAGGDRNNFTKQGIVDEIRRFLPELRVDYQKGGADRRNYRVDFRKIRERLGFEPAFGVADGIRETLDALKSGMFDDAASNRNFYGNYEIRGASLEPAGAVS